MNLINEELKQIKFKNNEFDKAFIK